MKILTIKAKKSQKKKNKKKKSQKRSKAKGYLITKTKAPTKNQNYLAKRKNY